MCTVTYLPLLSGGFVLTSNRDEKVARPKALEPELYRIGSHKLVFPKDPVGQGSWIVSDESGRTVCLLNGGLKPHLSSPPYKHSRGLVTLHYFDFKDPLQFVTNYSFTGLEPFTLIVVEQNQLAEIRWDGVHVVHKELEIHQPHIWSSSTLYTAPVIQKRISWFKQWIQCQDLNDFNPIAIIDFHRFAGEGDVENDVLMSRDGILQTVSITSILSTDKDLKIKYHDLINTTVSEIVLSQLLEFSSSMNA